MTTGNYYLDQGEAGQARLRQLAANDEHHIAVIERLGIAERWACLDLGAGGGSMTDWLCRSVGPTGRVVAIDLDTQNVERLGHPNLEVRKVDIVAHDLEHDAFDIVFARGAHSHPGTRGRAGRARRLAQARQLGRGPQRRFPARSARREHAS
ncbi:MAG: class I SAM-dependent methyltransferase [Dehalococcoidia bacterium]|nr:class I SAM-dependent methyltransferase [Dehalococcoidia bacterium]